MKRTARLTALVLTVACLSMAADAEEYRSGWAGVGLRFDNATSHPMTVAVTLTPFGHEKSNEVIEPGAWENYLFDLYQRTELTGVRAVVSSVDQEGGMAVCSPVSLPAGENLVWLRVEATGEGSSLTCSVLEHKFGSVWP